MPDNLERLMIDRRSVLRAGLFTGLGLAAAGVTSSETGIAVDGNLRTSNRRVYAIGDAVRGTRSVARAELQAEAVVRSILYRVPRKRDDWLAPRVAFTDPGFATVGLSEAAARASRRSNSMRRLQAASTRAAGSTRPSKRAWRRSSRRTENICRASGIASTPSIRARGGCSNSSMRASRRA